MANRVLDTGLIDLMMFSINPAYDLERGDEYGIGSSSERAARRLNQARYFRAAIRRGFRSLRRPEAVPRHFERKG